MLGLSVRLTHLTLFGGTLKHTYSKQLSVPSSGKLQRRLRLTYVTDDALVYLLTYLWVKVSV